MDELLEVLALGNFNANDMEDAILYQLINHEENNNNGVVFNLEEWSDDEAKVHFRFTKNDIRRLVQILGLPNEIRTYTRNRISSKLHTKSVFQVDKCFVCIGETALCIMLKRLTYPNRLKDLTVMFGLSPQSPSQIINHMLSHLVAEYGHLLDNLQNNRWLDEGRLQYYAHAVQTKGGAIPNCWGFIDGTTRSICRPTLDQEQYYSGHKRYHCLKYQSVLCPDGIIVSLKGGYPGRRHDAGIFRDSNLYDELERVARLENGDVYVLYGDQAYGIMELLLCPYPTRPNMPLHQQEFNNSMKLLRIAI
ncbi:uncharacterized protein LOC116167616 [Photinus pyralis]|uniref:uncharacterized protein LOC116167616 n=1 Tax=Photinus pyralis TaxID=7054 RepID=UPI00126711C0|nr:uncharacterized protein LOC116167616 [Photinus pyralis]